MSYFHGLAAISNCERRLALQLSAECAEIVGDAERGKLHRRLNGTGSVRRAPGGGVHFCYSLAHAPDALL